MLGRKPSAHRFLSRHAWDFSSYMLITVSGNVAMLFHQRWNWESSKSIPHPAVEALFGDLRQILSGLVWCRLLLLSRLRVLSSLVEPLEPTRSRVLEQGSFPRT